MLVCMYRWEWELELEREREGGWSRNCLCMYMYVLAAAANGWLRMSDCGSLDELDNFTFQSTGNTFTENPNHTS